MGAVLLKRGPHQLELTDIGQAVLQHCERISAEAAEAGAIVSEMRSQLRGAVRICVPFGLAQHLDQPRARARFALEYPDRRSPFVTNRHRWTSVNPFDVAICIGRMRNENLPARRLAELPRGVYGSPTYCERRGIPASPADLLQHDCIALGKPVAGQAMDARRPGSDRPTSVAPRMTVSDIIAAHRYDRGGNRIQHPHHAVCEAEVRAGRLVRVLPDWQIPPVTITAMFLERRRMPLRISRADRHARRRVSDVR